MKTESQLRSMATAQGLSLRKSRAALSLDNQGGYQISNTNYNRVEAGEKFDLSLEDVKKYLTEDLGRRPQ